MELLAEIYSCVISDNGVRVELSVVFAFCASCATYVTRRAIPKQFLSPDAASTFDTPPLPSICRGNLMMQIGYGIFFLAISIWPHISLSILPIIWLVSWFLITLSLLDIQHYLLPDILTLPLLWLGLGFNACTHAIPIEHAVAGAITGYTFIWLLGWITKHLAGKMGIGLGDAKLLAALGAWAGYENLALISASASLGGIIWWVTRQFCSMKKNHPLPFGPCLSIAGWVVIFDILQSWKLSFFFHLS
ncbi:A24 family peptidase [Hafnia alvei]|uniref:prepilin peptidase n=1 Tax=Hafnia alvei TaxID=569 RepID=UPI00345CD5D4